MSDRSTHVPTRGRTRASFGRTRASFGRTRASFGRARGPSDAPLKPLWQPDQLIP